jgi:uncharacterized protein YigA (DUF484 family)
MSKTLARLRQQKNMALDSMAELNDRARAESRDLTESERLDYSFKRSWAEELNNAIGLLELESQSREHLQQESQVAAPVAIGQGSSETDYFLGRDRDAPFLRFR